MKRNKDSQKKIQIILFSAVWIIIGMGIPFLLHYIYKTPDSNSVDYFLCFLLMISGALGIMWHLFQNTIHNSLEKIDFFSPFIFFPLVYSFFYGLGALELSGSEDLIPVSHYKYYFIGLFSYYGGLLSMRIAWIKPIKKNPLKINWDDSRLLKAMMALTALFIISTAYVFFKTKLPIFTGANVENLRNNFILIVGGYVTYFFRSIAIVLILLFVYVFTRRKKLFLSPWKMSFVLFGLVFLATLAARRAIIVPILTGVVVFHYANKKISLKNILVIGLVILLLIALTGYIRYIGSLNMEEFSISSRILKEINLYSALFETTLNFFPKQHGFLGWDGFLQPFKAIFPGRHQDIGMRLKEMMELRFRGGGFMPSILGGFYLNFGLWGIILGMFLVGCVSNALYINMLKKKDEFSIIIFAYLSVYIVSMIHGMVIGEFWPFYVISVLFLVHVYCKKKKNSLLNSGT